MVDFMEALDTQANEIEKPLNPPQGTYTFSVNKVPTVSTSGSGEWTIVEFPVQAVSAEEDVDSDQLEEYGEISNIFSRISFMAPTAADKDNDRKKTLHRLRKFMERTLQIEIEDGMTMRQMLDATVNHQFIAQLVWDPSKDDPEEVYVNLKNWAPLD